MAEMTEGTVLTQSSSWRHGKRHHFLEGLVSSAAWTVSAICGRNWGLQQQCRVLSSLALAATATSQEATAKGEEATGPECYPKEMFHKYT